MEKRSVKFYVLCALAGCVLVPSLAVGLQPLLTSSVQMPGGSNPIALHSNGMYNSGDSPRWVYQDGGTAPMIGAGGTIAGSVAATQVLFGTGANTAGGSANFTWDDSGHILAGGNVLFLQNKHTSPNTFISLNTTFNTMGGVVDYLQSTDIDGGAATAVYVNTLNSWSNASALLMQMATGGSDRFYFFANGVFELLTSSASAKAGAFRYTGSSVQISNDGSNWTDIETDQQGAQLTAATTITPTAPIHHITGATSIATIATTNLPDGSFFDGIADGGTITFTTGGNVAVGQTIPINTHHLFRRSGSTWYP